jgi:hypothetical protein
MIEIQTSNRISKQRFREEGAEERDQINLLPAL